MDRNRLALVAIILAILLGPGCLHKQPWEVTRPPVWPRYRIDGTVVDAETQEPLSWIQVTLTPKRFLFPDSFPTTVCTTGFLGKFHFEIPAAVVQLSFEDLQGGHWPQTLLLVVQRDRQISVALGPDTMKLTGGSAR